MVWTKATAMKEGDFLTFTSVLKKPKHSFLRQKTGSLWYVEHPKPQQDHLEWDNYHFFWRIFKFKFVCLINKFYKNINNNLSWLSIWTAWAFPHVQKMPKLYEFPAPIFDRSLNLPYSEPVFPKFFTANILFWEHLGIICFRPKNQSFL